MRNTIETIQEEAKQINWKIVSTEYKNQDAELEFECPEGHRVFTTLRKFRNKGECPICKMNPFKEPTEEYKKKPAGVKRVLALDQASNVSGYSIFDGDKLVKYGIFKTKGLTEDARIEEVKNWLAIMIANWKPDRIQLEDIQLQQHQKEDSDNVVGVTTYKVLAHLQGVLLNYCYEVSIPCSVVHVSTWRQYCGIKGKTKTDRKRNAQILVKDWYDISVTNDEADAICIGRYASSVTIRNTEMIDWE